MKPTVWLGILGLIVAGGILYVVTTRAPGQAPGDKRAVESSPDATEAMEHYPIPSQAEMEASGESKPDKTFPPNFDGKSLEDALNDLFDKDHLSALLSLDGLAQRIVVTVETARERSQLTPEHSLFRPLESDFLVQSKGEQTTISQANYDRYKPLVDLVRAVDPHSLVALYVHFYTTLQSAYDELGNRKYFNDRVIKLIDHLLKTPVVPGDPRVVRPGPQYKYKFADVELENLSSSQKLLIRMGYDNAQAVKAQLREIRRLLVKK